MLTSHFFRLQRAYSEGKVQVKALKRLEYYVNILLLLICFLYIVDKENVTTYSYCSPCLRSLLIFIHSTDTSCQRWFWGWIWDQGTAPEDGNVPLCHGYNIPALQSEAWRIPRPVIPLSLVMLRSGWFLAEGGGGRGHRCYYSYYCHYGTGIETVRADQQVNGKQVWRPAEMLVD